MHYSDNEVAFALFNRRIYWSSPGRRGKHGGQGGGESRRISRRCRPRSGHSLGSPQRSGRPPPPSLWTCAQPDTTRSPRPARARIPRAGRGATLYSRRMPAVLPGLLLQPQCRCAGTLSPRRASLRCTQHGPRKGPAQYGRRAALRHSAMTPSPAGARSRGRNIVLHDGSGRPAASSSWRAT